MSNTWKTLLSEIHLYLSAAYRLLTFVLFCFPYTGKHPWSHFTRCLSQKMRSHRYNQKRKSTFDEDKSAASRKKLKALEFCELAIQETTKATTEDYEDLKDSANKELAKKKTSGPKNHILHCLQQTFGNRLSICTFSTQLYVHSKKKEKQNKKTKTKGIWHITNVYYRLEEKRRRKKRKLNGLLQEWPCLQVGPYVSIYSSNLYLLFFLLCNREYMTRPSHVYS